MQLKIRKMGSGNFLTAHLTMSESKEYFKDCELSRVQCIPNIVNLLKHITFCGVNSVLF